VRGCRDRLAELSNRVSGAELRTTRAEEMVSNFKRERAGELLRELEEAAKVDTLALRRDVDAVINSYRRVIADRNEIQRLVSTLTPGDGAANGPASSVALERELIALERAHRNVGEIDPPLPTWGGTQWRQREDRVADLLKRRREKRSSGIAEAA
jgi:hypothetical protein